MNKKIFKVAVVAVIALVAGLNVYHSQTVVRLTDIQMENVEALAGGESSNCIEWVEKQCYYESDFSDIVGPDFYACCSGYPTVSGGMLKCGNMTVYKPWFPWSGATCLSCVR